MKRSKLEGPGIVTAVILALFILKMVYAGTDVRMNSDAPGDVQNEVRITQNAAALPLTNNLVVAYNDRTGSTSANPLGISYSTDGGVTWADTQLSVPTPPLAQANLPVIFDPMIDSDSQGNIYAGYIGAAFAGSAASGIYIERSTDMGQTWSGPTEIDFNVGALGPVDPTFRFNDRCDMFVDSNNNVCVVWIKDVGVNLSTSDIYFAKSPPPVPPTPFNPTGLDFTGFGPGSIAPKTINDNPGGGGGPIGCPGVLCNVVTPGTNPASDLANAPTVVSSGSTVYVAWVAVDVRNRAPKNAALMMHVSTDGGMSFACGITALCLDGSPLPGVPQQGLSSNLSTASGFAAGVRDDVTSGSYPVIALDPNNSQTIYMAYAADPVGSPDDPMGTDESNIYLTRSTDMGTSWSTPTLVNDDATTTDQFHPDIAVKSDGTIDIVWYDKRNATNDDAWDVYITKSTDGGATFSANTRITDSPSFASPTASDNSPWMGEYLGIEVDSSTAYIAFTSSASDAFGDVYFDSIANSAIGAGPPSQCPRSHGFWKNHIGAWPVTSLVLGSQTYSQRELIALLRRPTKGDASLILAKQLIAAKLNIANGSDPTPAAGAIASADTILSGFSGKLPYRLRTRRFVGRSMTRDAAALDDYNGRLLTPNCTR
ncbi:MAG: sialidase family protein [Planctomycetota bacterium]|nr:sialidase family protein [Planctomycetota bacterium]